jgi:hypothetical protein
MIGQTWVRQWLRKAFRNSRTVETERARQARHRGFQPLLEALEEKIVLSTATQTFTGSSFQQFFLAIRILCPPRSLAKVKRGLKAAAHFQPVR